VTSASRGRSEGAPTELRLECKRAFASYYVELCSSRVATPTDAFDACAAYLTARRAELGDALFFLALDAEMDELAGEVEQDLRFRRMEGLSDCLAREPLAVRLRECAEAGLRRR
jgi:hypothetical protein